MLQAVVELDKKISTPIIQADNPVISVILYPFAAFFHPKLIFLAYISVFYFSGKNVHSTVVYLLGTGLCLLTTYIIKRITKRARPLLVETTQKPHHFRIKEKNNSFPSGDAIQSALFVFYLYHLGVPTIYLVIFHVGVCLGRVYYMCHWILDTVASTFLGLFISQVLLHLLEVGFLQPVVAQLEQTIRSVGEL